jgi:hypothetical protein
LSTDFNLIDKLVIVQMGGQIIEQETVGGMRIWSHSCYSIGNLVRIEAKDHTAM